MSPRTRSAALVLAGLALGGCRRPAPPAEPQGLETVAVAPNIDAAADASGDPKAKAARAEALGGVLPSDFPRQFPLPPGGSIVDLGEADGRSFVVIHFGTPANDVLRKVSGLAQSRGWTREGDTYRLGALEVIARATARGMATELRLEYRP